MKFIFPILSILVCGVAAYFTLAEKEKFEAEQEARFVAIRTNESVSKTLAEAIVDIAEEEKLLEAAKTQLATDTASVSFLQSNLGNFRKEAAELDVTLELQRKQAEEIRLALENINRLLNDEGGNVTRANFQARFDEIVEEIKAKQTKLEEMETLVEGAKASLALKQAEVARLVERLRARNQRISMNSMEARITAVNHEWGFLVIGAGSNSGFTPQTSLLVKRDGRLIGKVTPSAIEPTQTIAEIDLETLAPGVRIQPGDKVILATPSKN